MILSSIKDIAFYQVKINNFLSAQIFRRDSIFRLPNPPARCISKCATSFKAKDILFNFYFPSFTPYNRPAHFNDADGYLLKCAST
jgi:hypothetical protein